MLVEVDNESGDIVEEEDEDTSTQKLNGRVDVGANNVGSAFVEAMEFLNSEIGEDNWNITSIKEITKMNLINWPGDNDECQCLSCRTERAAPEDTIQFKHNCGGDIRVVESGWEKITCPNCNKEIFRDRIIGSNGNYIFHFSLNN